jgi:hypothetical protein
MPSYEVDADGIRLVVTTSGGDDSAVVFVDDVSYSIHPLEPTSAERIEARIEAAGPRQPSKPARVTRVPVRAIDLREPPTLPDSDVIEDRHIYQVRNACVLTPAGWIAHHWRPADFCPCCDSLLNNGTCKNGHQFLTEIGREHTKLTLVFALSTKHSLGAAWVGSGHRWRALEHD